LDQSADGLIGAGPGGLPVSLSRFVGRDAELATIGRLRGETRLLTLTGPGGTGKTRLALELARAAADGLAHGARLVELASLAESARVPEAVATVLGVADASGQPLVETLVRALRTRHMLLVVDNCEHVVHGCAALIEALLHECPDLSVLATSREPLGITGELVWRVPPLTIPLQTHGQGTDEIASAEAVQLFVDRARLVRPGFALTDDTAGAVAEICRRVDGIPLAIELAAARARVLTPAEILTRLDDRFTLLTDGDRTAPARHSTLEATLAWSYQLLTDDERTLFGRLAVFNGGWTLEAAEAVCSAPPLGSEALLDILSALTDKSLVVAEARGLTTRFRMLETVRSYAMARLQDAGEEALVRARHQAWYFGLFEEVHLGLYGPDQTALMSRLDAEVDNLRVALEWCRIDPITAAIALERCVPTLWRYWDMRGYVAEALNHASQLLELAGEAASSSARAQALALLAYCQAMSGSPAAGKASLDAAEALVGGVRDTSALFVLWMQTLVNTMLLDFQAATSSCLRAWKLAEDMDHPWGPGPWSFWLGEISRQLGDLPEANRLLDISYAATRELGNTRDLALVRLVQGRAAIDQGEIETAERLLLEAVSLSWSTRDAVSIPASLDALAAVVVLRKQPERAARLLGAAQAASEFMGTAIPALWQREHGRAVTESREALGERRFSQAFAAGYALSVNDAVQSALAPGVEAPVRLAHPGGLSERELQVAELGGPGADEP
jgi:non-specific serine/threonine protein kinase